MAWLGATSADRPGDITRGSHPAYWSFVHSLPRRANLLPSTTILHPPAMIFNPTRLKVQLKLSINRLKMLQSKKSAQNQHQRREIAHLLEAGKEESARIRRGFPHGGHGDTRVVLRAVVGEVWAAGADEVSGLQGGYDYRMMVEGPQGGSSEHRLEVERELLDRNRIIFALPFFPRFLRITSNPSRLKELRPRDSRGRQHHHLFRPADGPSQRARLGTSGVVRDQLVAKFGKDFALAALENQNDVVNSRIISKLQINTPDPYLVTRYLEEIAKSYSVRWTSDGGADDDDDNGGLAE
ncbi:hypothetical protein BC936DRAFT_139661, partial [Jimgerdemannia flammicorona]